MFEPLIGDFVELAPHDLDAVLADAELAKRRIEARIAAAAAILSARGSYRDHGQRSMKAHLKGTLNCSGSTANKIRKRADAMSSHTEIGDALLEGRIGVEQADLLAKAHSHRVAGQRFGEFAPQLLDHAEHLELSDFDTVIAHFIDRADPDGSFDDQQFHEHERTASVTVTNGAVDVHATGGSPLAAAEITAIFDTAVQAEFERDCDTRRAEHGDNALAEPLPRTAPQRKFDALHAIFMRSITAPADGRTPEPLVNIIVDHVTAGHALAAHGLLESADILGIGDEALARAEADLLSQRCSINATPVHPDVAVQAIITGRIRRAVVDADRVTVDLGRTQRLFTGKARQAAQLLAIACIHRGCDIPAQFCDVDHRAEWVDDDGPTDQHNAMVLCGGHDRWKHANKIRSRRAANGRIYLIRPDGTTIKPVGETEPDWAEPEPVGSTRPVVEADPWAAFGRPITQADLTADLAMYREPLDHGWVVRIIECDTIRNRSGRLEPRPSRSSRSSRSSSVGTCAVPDPLRLELLATEHADRGDHREP